MKKFRKYMSKHIGAALFVLLGFNVYQASALEQPQAGMNATEATAVVNQYMQALMQGDINTVRGLLDEKLLERKAGMFSNPTYPQFLQKLYNNASKVFEERSGFDNFIIGSHNSRYNIILQGK